MKTWASIAIAITIATVVAGAPSLALAHHSFAAFDRSKKVVLVGVVKDFQWTNPHAWIQLVVQDSQGHQTEWGVECGSPNMMARTGWKKELLQPGDQVAVTVNPLADGRPNGSLVSITLANGAVLGPGDAPPPKPLGSSTR
jgi:hypothetical protein